MLGWERKIRPACRPRPWRQDILCAALLAMLGAVLLPRYAPAWGWLVEPGAEDTYADQLEYLSNVAGQMASNYLLAAMGFALVLRQGGIDLSIWAVAGLGGVAAAGLIRAGVPPWASFAAAAGAGAIVGLLNSLLVLRLRAPTVLATLGVGLLIAVALHLGLDGRAVAVDEQAFNGWTYWPAPPLLVGRMLIVLGAYALVLVGLMNTGVMDDPSPRSHRVALGAALVLSGALAGLSGAIWLMDRSQAPLPLRPMEELRVPAAALLAGAALLGGPGRTLVTGLLLPPALLVATAWRQLLPDLPWLGYHLQLVLLMGMVLVAHLAFAALTAGPPPHGLAGCEIGGGAAERPRAPRRKLSAASAVLCAAGLLLTARGGVVALHPSGWLFLSGGMACWLIGAVLLALARTRAA